MKTTEFHSLINGYASDILYSSGMQAEKSFIQHGTISVFEHSIHVVYLSICIASILHLSINRRALIRGGLLHDYFLYDWHIPSLNHRLHGFRHAGLALKNATRDFKISFIERDIIQKHMFPLNPALPKYRETVLICISDKICAVCETLASDWTRKRMKSCLFLKCPPLHTILTKKTGVL